MKIKFTKNIETIYLDDFTNDGMIIEKEFRKKIKNTNIDTHEIFKECNSVTVRHANGEN